MSNEATRVTTGILGITYAIAGFTHGFFEALQGSTPTGGLPVHAIGPAQLMWEGGTEDAITVIPNFLATGIAAMAVSVLIVVWCLRFLDRPRGTTGFLLLFVALTLVGGGIGHIAFFVPAWAYATRIHTPLTGWRRALPERLRPRLARAWLPLTATSSLFFLIGLAISVTGVVPGVTDTAGIYAVCWSFLLASLVMQSVAYAAAFAYDIERRVAAVGVRAQ